jgi:hypothetical protein
MNIKITKKDVKDARLLYQWLFFAPLVAVPCWAFNGSNLGTRHFPDALWSAALPLIFYAPVFIWAFAPNPYARAHARQGVILLALRFSCAVLVGTGSSYMLAGNLVLWLVGSLVGLSQAANGRAWIGNIHAEVLKDVTPAAASKPIPAQDSEYYLKIFRTGDPDAREAAVRKLEALGQVETF